MARQSWLSRFSPARAWGSATARPGQAILRTGLGLIGSALGGPVLGQAISQGVGAWQDRRNDAAFDRGAAQLTQSGIENNNAAIWGNPGAATGQPSAYQPLLPNSPSYGVQSPLLRSLGIPSYTEPQAPSQGLPGITSPLLPSMGPSGSVGSGWAHTGRTGQIGTGTGPNPFNLVGRTDRFSDAAQ